ncbi:MAG TPA: patatin-like phospholipase family protein [Pyrinomonadaceae bacterium]|jgi:NTE family protein|nr:patatin-like phospholipase family protein [Pyrinomonadaceae bacterium]
MTQRLARLDGRPRLGLALSGGAARGMAHVGVLKVFEEEGVRVDCVAGTSAGALVGGALAAGMTSEEIAKIARGMRWRDLGRMTLSRLGIQSSALMEDYVRARFPVTRFEELRIPFAAVATDLHTGEAVVMRDRGDVAFAIRASCALPGWYVPVTDPEGRQLVDGGLVANLPVSVARSLGADSVVAVDVNYEGAKFLGKPATMVGVLLQSMVVVQQTAVLHERRLADVCISPAVGHLRWDEMKRTDEFIAAGIESARAAIPAVKELLEQSPSEDESRLQLHHARD